MCLPFYGIPWGILEMHCLVKMQGVHTATYLLAMFLGLIFSQHPGNFPWAVWLASLSCSLSYSIRNHPDTRLAVLLRRWRISIIFIPSLVYLVSCCFPSSLVSVTAANMYIIKTKSHIVVWGNVSYF